MKKLSLLIPLLIGLMACETIVQAAAAEYPDIEAMDLDDENPDEQEALGRIYLLLNRIEDNIKAHVFNPALNPQGAGIVRNTDLTRIQKIRNLLEEGPDGFDHNTGNTDFLIACSLLHSEEKGELFRALIDYHRLFGEDHFFRWINHVNNEGSTPLKAMRKCGDCIDLFALLLQHGASPDRGKFFPAVDYGRENTLRYVLTTSNSDWDIPYKNLINQYAPAAPAPEQQAAFILE